MLIENKNVKAPYLVAIVVVASTYLFPILLIGNIFKLLLDK
jgi:hypothetical protein